MGHIQKLNIQQGYTLDATFGSQQPVQCYRLREGLSGRHPEEKDWGMQVDRWLNMSQQCDKMDKKANKWSTTDIDIRIKEVIALLCSLLFSSYLLATRKI